MSGREKDESAEGSTSEEPCPGRTYGTLQACQVRTVSVRSEMLEDGGAGFTVLQQYSTLFICSKGVKF
jgi:hypothetical protein